MIRQGYRAQTNYRKSETLPEYQLRSLGISMVFNKFFQGKPDTRTLIEKGIQNLNDEKYEIALENFNEALKTAPSNVRALVNASKASFLLKRYDEAIAYINSALVSKPKNDYIWFLKAQYLEKISNNSQAIECYDKVLEIAGIENPTLSEVIINKAYCLAREEQYDAAIEFLEMALHVNPSKSILLNALGQVMHWAERYDEALIISDKLLEEDPDNKTLQENRQFILAEISSRDNIGSTEIKGMDEKLYGRDIDQIMNHVDKKIMADILTLSLLVGMDRKNDALEYAEELIPRSNDPLLLSTVYAIKGSILSGLDQNEKAIEAFCKAIEIDPEYSYAFLELGMSLIFIGKPEDGEKISDVLIRIDSENPLTWMLKGNSLKGQQKHYESVVAYEKAINIDPEFGLAWMCKGNALKSLGNHDEGNLYISKALELDPSLQK